MTSQHQPNPAQRFIRVSNKNGSAASPNKNSDLVVMEARAAGKTRLRAAIYGRTSSGKQQSIPGQLDECRRRCKERGWDIKYILKDEGLGGDNADRPGFQRLMDLAEAGQIDVVVCWKIDRLARSLAHAVILEEVFREHGAAITSCTEPIDTTTPVGRFIFGNLANASALELAMIKDRTLMGKQRIANEGRWGFPQAPFGYRKTRGMKLRVHQDEAVQVRRVFEYYERAGSYAEAATLLQADGYRYLNGAWTVRRVRQVLENALYAGRYDVSGVHKTMPALAIVSEEVFDRVTRLRSAAARDGLPASQLTRDAAIASVFDQYLASLDYLDPVPSA